MGSPKLENSLRVARARIGMTQAQLAEEARVTRKTINSIENGRYVPSTHLALVVAKVLGVSVDEVFRLPDEVEHGE